MPLLSIVLVLIVVGVLLWVAKTYIPMDPAIQRIITALVIVVVVIWILQQLGLLGALSSVRIR